jgi:hypothetical protein
MFCHFAWLLKYLYIEELRFLMCISDSFVYIVTGYGLDGWGSNPVRRKIFLFSSAQTGSDPASYPMRSGDPFPLEGVKTARTL